jgi:hypothetical protein
LRLATANPLNISLDILDGPDGQLRAFYGIEQVLTARINGNAALRYDYIDQFARAGQGCDFVDDHRDAIAEGRDGEYGASGKKAILPATDAMQ